MKRQYVQIFIKRIPLIGLILLFTPCYAQYQERNEVSFFAGGGYSTLYHYLHQVPDGKFKPGYGGTTGLGYTRFFNDFIGIGTGFEIGYYTAQTTIAQFSDKYSAFDKEDNFEFRYTVDGYSEKQNLWAVNIPLMLHLQLPLLHDDHLCYVALGGRVGFPVRSEYNSSASTYTTSAYYPQYDVLLESPASQGLGVFHNRKYKDELKFHTMYMLSAELGMKWLISNQFSLYTGVYFDFGSHDIYKNKQYEYFLKYSADKPAALPNQSILKSRSNQDNHIDSFAGKVLPNALGIKIRLAFRIPDKGSCCF
ncbi:hypothetical protein AGMMS50239_25590 [Bacteroidia bacterium]|nr:hypothetical protein AGMMS50239_25590 [Bacteroidia bacterium]